jgi:hypothetical protein
MKKNSGFVSEIDQFLQKFDQEHPELSAAQRKEKLKYERIYRLRDSKTNAINDEKSSLFD